jgi:hypothetical protein
MSKLVQEKKAKEEIAAIENRMYIDKVGAADKWWWWWWWWW